MCVFVHVLLGYLSTSDIEKLLAHIKMQILLVFLLFRRSSFSLRLVLKQIRAPARCLVSFYFCIYFQYFTVILCHSFFFHDVLVLWEKGHFCYILNPNKTRQPSLFFLSLIFVVVVLVLFHIFCVISGGLLLQHQQTAAG